MFLGSYLPELSLTKEVVREFDSRGGDVFE